MSSKKYSEKRANKPIPARFDHMRDNAVPLPRSKVPLHRDKSLTPEGADQPTRIRSYIQPNKNYNPFSNREPREVEKMVPDIVKSGVIYSKALLSSKDDLLHQGADRLSDVPTARASVQPRGLYQQVKKNSFNERSKSGADSARRPIQTKSTIPREQPMPKRIAHTGVSRISNAENEPAPVPEAPHRQSGKMGQRDVRRPSVDENPAAPSRKRSADEDDVEEMKQEPVPKKERNMSMSSDKQDGKKSAPVVEHKKNEAAAPQKKPENRVLNADDFEPEIARKCIASIGIRVNKATKEKHPSLCGTSHEIQVRIAKLRSNALRGIPVPKLKMPEALPKQPCAEIDKVGEIQDLFSGVSGSSGGTHISGKLEKSNALGVTSFGNTTPSSSETKSPATQNNRKWSKAPVPPPIKPRVAKVAANGTPANNGSTSSKIHPVKETASDQNGILNGVKTPVDTEMERNVGTSDNRSLEKIPKNEAGGDSGYQRAQPPSAPKACPVPSSSRQSDVVVKEEMSDDDEIIFLAQITPQGKEALRKKL